MSELPTFHVPVPFRCYERDDGFPNGWICGRLARWQRVDPDTAWVRFFCGQHRKHGDGPIEPGGIVRRVCLMVEIVFTAAAEGDTPARLEALDRLERIAHDAGAVLNLHCASSQLGRLAPSAAPRVATASGDGPTVGR